MGAADADGAATVVDQLHAGFRANRVCPDRCGAHAEDAGRLFGRLSRGLRLPYSFRIGIPHPVSACWGKVMADVMTAPKGKNPKLQSSESGQEHGPVFLPPLRP